MAVPPNSKYLKTHAPEGVYVLPAFDSLYLWHGVIFIRRETSHMQQSQEKNIYEGGIFRFTLTIPRDYPESRPSVRFQSKIYHPLIDPKTGELALDSLFPSWTRRSDNIMKLLTKLRKIFIHVDTCLESCNNKEAAELYRRRREDFVLRAKQSVEDSIHNAYENPEGSSIIFKRHEDKHEVVRKCIYAGAQVEGEEGEKEEEGQALNSKWFEIDPVLKWFESFGQRIRSLNRE